jgi:hypothetical protein
LRADIIVNGFDAGRPAPDGLLIMINAPGRLQSITAVIRGTSTCAS